MQSKILHRIGAKQNAAYAPESRMPPTRQLGFLEIREIEDYIRRIDGKP